MPTNSLFDRVRHLLGPLIEQRGFSITTVGDQTSSFGACVHLRTSEFLVDVVRDRGQESITVGTTVRPKPRAPLRSSTLAHLVAFLDGQTDPYPVSDLETEARWLTERADQILDSSVINSEELRKWKVRASRRQWGQR